MPHEQHRHGEENKTKPTALILSALLFSAALLLGRENGAYLFLAAYAVSGFAILREAADSLLHGALFDENFLMTLASLGAAAIGEYDEAAAVMLLYRLGEAMQDRAVDSSRSAIRALMAIRPDHAELYRDGSTETVPAEDVSVGALIRIRAGETIPLDGTVVRGSTEVDTAALTGESLPQEVAVGGSVQSGCVNLTGTILVRVDKVYAESSASRILKSVEEAAEKKARPERFMTRFARVYTPAVTLAALLLTVLPPLLGMGSIAEYSRRALNFLVISCPCALVISVPLSFYAGIGCASAEGILIKGGTYLEGLSRAGTVLFDKTGTLTKGQLSVESLLPNSAELLKVAAYAESGSNHPLARAVVRAYPEAIEPSAVTDYREFAGKGITATVFGRAAITGRASFLRENGISAPDFDAATSIAVGYDGTFLGTLVLRDQAKDGAEESIRVLRRLGVGRIAILSGDRGAAVQSLGREVGISEVYFGLLPQQKLARLTELRTETQRNGSLLYIGDGMNDAPVLTAADVGIAMGALGSDAAMEAADVVIMGDELEKIPEAIRLSRRTMRIVRENIVFSIGCKLLVLIMSMFGFVQLWAAVFADVGVCLLAILNSLRLMKRRRI